MSIILSQHISRYYDEYSSLDVTFTKDVVKALRLVPKMIFMKCLGYQWPCIIYSCSMSSAKIIVNARLPIREITQKANNTVSLHISIQAEKPDPVSFFVSARVAGFSPYGAANPELDIIALSFTQRPADDLIGALGQILEANVNSKRRKEVRIILNPEIRAKMGIAAKETTVIVQGIPRKGIVRDLSFSGAKVIIVGVAKFIMDKPVTVHLEMTEGEILKLEGKVLRSEPVEGRRDISAFAIQFLEEQIPMRYKMVINDYVRLLTKSKGHAARDEAPLADEKLPPPPADAAPVQAPAQAVAAETPKAPQEEAAAGKTAE